MQSILRNIYVFGAGGIVVGTLVYMILMSSFERTLDLLVIHVDSNYLESDMKYYEHSDDELRCSISKRAHLIARSLAEINDEEFKPPFLEPSFSESTKKLVSDVLEKYNKTNIFRQVESCKDASN